MKMNEQLLWYNPVEKKYQVGDKKSFKNLLRNSNEPQNFILLEKFCNINQRMIQKIKSKIEMLNNFSKSTSLAYCS